MALSTAALRHIGCEFASQTVRTVRSKSRVKKGGAPGQRHAAQTRCIGRLDIMLWTKVDYFIRNEKESVRSSRTRFSEKNTSNKTRPYPKTNARVLFNFHVTTLGGQHKLHQQSKTLINQHRETSRFVSHELLLSRRTLAPTESSKRTLLEDHEILRITVLARDTKENLLPAPSPHPTLSRKCRANPGILGLCG